DEDEDVPGVLGPDLEHADAVELGRSSRGLVAVEPAQPLGVLGRRGRREDRRTEAESEGTGEGGPAALRVRVRDVHSLLLLRPDWWRDHRSLTRLVPRSSRDPSRRRWRGGRGRTRFRRA